MTLEDKLRRWLKQPGTVLTEPEWHFISDMRLAALRGVGYGFMQQVIEWEWQSKDLDGALGPEWFQNELKREK